MLSYAAANPIDIHSDVSLCGCALSVQQREVVSYPEACFDKGKLYEGHEPIKRDGFEPDAILPVQLDRPVYGLNIPLESTAS